MADPCVYRVTEVSPVSAVPLALLDPLEAVVPLDLPEMTALR